MQCGAQAGKEVKITLRSGKCLPETAFGSKSKQESRTLVIIKNSTERKRKKHMRNMKKLVTVLIAAVMVMAMGISAMAEPATGSVKIKNAAATRTYTAYKIFGATANGDAVAYTTDASGKAVIEDDQSAPFTVSSLADSDGLYNVTVTSGKTNADVISWLKENYESFDSTGTTGADDAFDSTSGTYTISGLALGYYYITTGTGSEISIDTVTGTEKEIIDKNTDSPNTPAKEITAEDGTALASAAKSNAARVGSTETFKVTYNATNWVTSGSGSTATTTKIENFYIKDTPTGLSINADSIKVTVNGSEITKGTDYSAEIDATTGTLKITIPWTDETTGNFLYQPTTTNSANIPVAVTYDAAITAAAATATAENKVQIYYNHDSTSGSDGTEVTEPDNPPKTTTDTYKFQLNKVDENQAALLGAQFELYDGDTKVPLVKDGSVYRAAAASDTSTTTVIDMTEASTVEIKGLNDKTYTLKEIKAPDGYTLASDTTIGASDSTETNRLVKADTAAYNDSANGKVTVINQSGSLLPQTGGIGTTIFYVLGTILVIGAGILLVTRRCMSARK